MKAIVGIEIPIDHIEGRWKLSQNRTETDRFGVVAGLNDPEDPDKNMAMAQLMTKRSDSH